MESVEVLDSLSIGHGRGNFRFVTIPCIILGKLLHYSLRLFMGLLQGRENMECISEGCWNAGRIIS